MARFSRKTNERQPKKVIRIYTEGESTEPNYFNAIKSELRIAEIDIRVDGRGDHTLPLMEWVIERKNVSGDTEDETEWWVVFDRDDHADFNRAIERGRSEGIHVIYSNESFELWFILHFELLQSSLGRANFPAKLTKLLGKKYEKNMDVYSLIKDRETSAIRNAKQLEKQHDGTGVISPLDRDPSTKVYELVERLRSLKIL